MIDAIEDHVGTVSIGGRKVKRLRFADDIDGLAGDEQEQWHRSMALTRRSM